MIRFDCALARPDFALDVTFEAEKGITALFGPSGSGKSTVIRLLAGLERPDRGAITLDGARLLDTSARINIPSHRRRMGLVFQDALLLPHLSVKSNLIYGRFFTPKTERRIALEAVIDVLGIGHLMDRRPATLSGGERQRVAIGRALLTSPRLLLMDEPLASLDAARKLEILPFIEKLRDEFGIPILYVSHSVEEVARLASRVVRLAAGKVAAIGPPDQVLGETAADDRFEAISLLTARCRNWRADYAVTVFDHPAGEIIVPGRAGTEGAQARIAIRATNVTLALWKPEQVSVRTMLAGEVTAIAVDDGPFARVTLRLEGGERLVAFATRLAVDSLGIDVGDKVFALVKAAAIDERGLPGAAAAHSG